MKDLPKIIEAPSGFVKQLSGRDLSGRTILSVVVKLRFKIRGGACAEPEGEDLLEEPKFSDDGWVMEEEADLFPDKGATDFRVKGKVHGGGKAMVDAGVEVAGRRSEWRVFGKRTVTGNGSGGLAFSAPEPFDEIEIGFRNAYGGVAEHAEKAASPPWKEMFPKYAIPEEEQQPWATPFSYPRNPAGKGYVVGSGPECAVGVELPNIEVAGSLVTPENLICPELAEWPRMPLPAPVGVVSYDWFPRSGYCNMVRPYNEVHRDGFEEVKRGYAGREVGEIREQSPEAGHRFACAAAGPFQVPFLRGGERISSWEIGGAGKKIDVRLPAAPKIWTDGRKGTLKPAEVTIDSVTLDADKDEVTIVWRGRAEALRAYLPDELEKMPLKVEFT